MTSTEVQFWSLIKRSWPQVHAVRIENTAGFGIPDINCCYNSYEFWLELKILHGKFITVRNTQAAWFAKRVHVKGNVGIFVAETNTNTCSLYYAGDLFNTGVLITMAGQLKADVTLMTPIVSAPLTKDGLTAVLNSIMKLRD